jgi:hypothetical protein
MGEVDFAWADALRRAHFPPERNRVPAHITLFHHLPPSCAPELLDHMRRLSAQAPPPAILAAVMNLGGGVAYRIDSPALQEMRAELADRFQGLLTPQDRAHPRLHLTIQNKVRPEDARALHDTLCADFRPRPLVIAGLAAWHYMGGPWELLKEVRFRGRR